MDMASEHACCCHPCNASDWRVNDAPSEQAFLATNGALLKDAATQNSLWHRISAAMPDTRRSSNQSNDGSQGQHRRTTEPAGFNADDSVGRHGYQSYRTSLAQVPQTVHKLIPIFCLSMLQLVNAL